MFKRTLLLTSFALLALTPAAFADGHGHGHGHGHDHGHGHLPPIGVVATGLDNPRGIDVDRATGAVYVAEAGRGGAGPCMAGGEDEEVCLGATGAITRIGFGHQRRVVEGLPSTAGEGGEGATGPQDVDVHRFGFGAFVTGLGGTPAGRASLGDAGAGLGSLFTFTPFGRTELRADLAAYEAAADPDKAGVDSNPNSVLLKRRGFVAVDAGGNDLLRVGRRGTISTLGVFPTRPAPDPAGNLIPSQAVPTAVAQGPDGAFYVSELRGFPFPVGGARIYRVVPGSPPEIYVDEGKLTNVTDLAFGRDGSLYAVQIANDGLLSVPEGAPDSVGSLVQIGSDGTVTTVDDDLPTPYGVATGRHGSVFVTTHATAAGRGEVLRVR